MVSGASPHRPARIASTVPCPLPVALSDPWSSTLTRTTRDRSPRSSSVSTKVRAARMGPTVWELEGPTPIRKRSKTLNRMMFSPQDSAEICRVRQSGADARIEQK